MPNIEHNLRLLAAGILTGGIAASDGFSVHAQTDSVNPAYENIEARRDVALAELGLELSLIAQEYPPDATFDERTFWADRISGVPARSETNQEVESSIRREIDLGAGSTLDNQLEDKGIVINPQQLVPGRSNLEHLQRMFEKYSEGRVIRIFITNTISEQIVSEGISYPNFYTLYGVLENEIIELHYVLDPYFDSLDSSRKAQLARTVNLKLWGFLAAYNFMNKENFLGFMLQDDQGTGILPLPPEMSRELGPILTPGIFAYKN